MERIWRNTSVEDKREFQRYTVRLMVQVTGLEDKRVDIAYTHDISAKGAGLVCKEQFGKNSHIDLWLYSAIRGEPFYIKGEVVWSKVVDQNTWRMGIEFERADFMGISKVLGLHD